MLRTEYVILLIMFILISGVFAQENDRRSGIFFGTSVSPELSYQMAYTSIEGSGDWFAKPLGGLQVSPQIDFSRNGKNFHAIQAAFSWNFPTARFLGSVSSGYSFVHYFSQGTPSLALGYEIDYSLRLNGPNDNWLFPPGTQVGLKTGYEMGRHVTCWIGYLLSFECYTYSFDKSTIDANDLSNTIRALGTVNAHELVFANRFQISFGYLFY
jgi:hypothetical protein